MTKSDTSSAIEIGHPVADFTLPATNGDFSLSAHRGKPVVIYFYPKDNTPGCTTQTQQYGEHHAAFRKAGAVVVGVSRDSLASHQKFKTKLALPFELLADTESRVCTLFGVIKPKKLYGKEFIGIERSSFLIDAEGVLREAWRGVKADGNAATVLAAVQALKATR